MNNLIIKYKINLCCAGLHYFSLVGSLTIAIQLVCTGGAFPRPTRLAGLSETSDDAFIARLNYGWVAEKIMQVCVADGYVAHTYHLALPKRADVEADPHNFTFCELENSAADCQRMTGLVDSVLNLTLRLKQSVNYMLDKIFRLVPNINRQLPVRISSRSQRGLVDGIGYASAYLFGTATKADIDSLSRQLTEIRTLSAVSSADSQRYKQGLETLSRVVSARLGNLHGVVDAQHVMLSDAVKQIRSVKNTASLEFKAIAYIANELSRFILVHDSINELENGIDNLVQGRLTPNLLSVDSLASVLNNVSSKLMRNGLRLCFENAKDVYNLHTYEFARSGHDLIIRVLIPYTNLPKLNVYETHVLSIPVPNKNDWFTTIKGIPPVIIVAPESGIIGEITGIPDGPVIESNRVNWYRENEKSCLFSIVADDPDWVRTQCNFSTQQGMKQSTVLRLSQNVYVLSNFVDLSLICFRQKEPTRIMCNPCLITLGCGCEVRSPTSDIVKRSCIDQNSTDSKIEHVINLAMLQHFYDITNLTASGKTLFGSNDKIIPEQVNWNLYSEKVSNLLAADDSQKYSLQKLAASLKNNSVAFHSPVEVLLSEIINQQANHSFLGIDLSVLNTWVIVILIAIIAFLCFFQYRLRRELNGNTIRISQLVMSTALINGAKSQVIFVKPLSTVTTITIDESISIRDYLRDDLISFIIFITLLIGFLLLVIYLFLWTIQMRSFVYIEFRTTNESFLVFLQTTT